MLGYLFSHFGYRNEDLFEYLKVSLYSNFEYFCSVLVRFFCFFFCPGPSLICMVNFQTWGYWLDSMKSNSRNGNKDSLSVT